ncbi:MAG TPA: alpha/beta hydrolase [Pirellulaceae bacterium]|nr:alpha/beta hydrolase [Pirellulaceae bacterium]
MSSQPETTFLDIRGKKTQLTVGGEGPPLLYLHSAGGETDWMPFHAALAKQYRVYLPAHPGFALSGGLDQIKDIHDMVWHYVDLMSALKLEQVPVVGFSLGAWLAMELAVLRPNLVSKLVLVNAAGVRVENSRMAELFIDDFDEIRNLLFFDPSQEAIVKQAMPLSIDDSRILMWLRAREATARVGWNPYLHNPKLQHHLDRIACPTLGLWGRQDKLIPLPHGEFIASAIPHAKLQVLDNCGHMLPFEKCGEFAERVCAFVGE